MPERSKRPSKAHGGPRSRVLRTTTTSDEPLGLLEHLHRRKEFWKSKAQQESEANQVLGQRVRSLRQDLEAERDVVATLRELMPQLGEALHPLYVCTPRTFSQLR